LHVSGRERKLNGNPNPRSEIKRESEKDERRAGKPGWVSELIISNVETSIHFSGLRLTGLEIGF